MKWEACEHKHEPGIWMVVDGPPITADAPWDNTIHKLIATNLSEAEAKLAAAAPDLLAACRKTLNQNRNDCCVSANKADYCYVCACAAALAKLETSK